MASTTLPPSLRGTQGSAKVIMEWRDRVEEDSFLRRVGGGTPLSENQGGIMAKFDLQAFKSRMESTLPYVCLGCLDWSSPLESVHHVSVDTRKVQRKALLKYPGGAPPNQVDIHGLEVCIAVVEPSSNNPAKHLGSLLRISPDEEVLELWCAMSHLTTLTGDEATDSHKRVWAKIKRNVIHRFIPCSRDQLGVLAASLRESKLELADHIEWTPTQRAEFVVAEKHRLSVQLSKPYSSITNIQVFKVLKSIKQAERSEVIKEAYISAAIVVADRLLTVNGVREALASLDAASCRDARAPLHSMYQLQIVVQQCKTAEVIAFTLGQLARQFVAGDVHIEDLTQRKLAATLQTILLQRQFLLHFWSWCEKHQLQGHEELQSRLDPANVETNFDTDLSWQSRLCESTLTAALLCYDVCYTAKHRMAIRNVQHGNSTVLQLVESERIKTTMGKVLELAEAELVKAAAASSQTPLTVRMQAQSPDSPPPAELDAADPKQVPDACLGVEVAAAQTKKRTLPDDARNSVDKVVEAYFKRYCSVLVYPVDPDAMLLQLPDLIRDNSVANAPGDDTGVHMTWCDTKCFAEAATQPRTRMSPVPLDRYVTIVNSILSARYRGQDATKPSMNVGDVVVLLDGHRQNNKRLLQPWIGPLTLASDAKTPQKPRGRDDGQDMDVVDDNVIDVNAEQVSDQMVAHNQLTVTVTESSLKARRCIVKRAMMSLPLSEQAHILSLGLSLPVIDCPVFPGQSNAGNMLGPLTLTPENGDWQETVARKKKIYGQFRVQVGGRTHGEKVQRSDSDNEPVFFNWYPGECRGLSLIKLCQSWFHLLVSW